MTTDEIYKRACESIKQHGTRNPDYIIKEKGILLLERDDFGSLLGAYTYKWKHRIIFINNRLEEIMRKMVLAHELGHDTLHQPLAKNKSLQEFELFDMASRPEYEANAYAAHLLLDDAEVYHLAKEGYDIVALSAMMNVNINLMLIKLQEMNKMGYDYRMPDIPKSDFFKDIKS